MQTEVQNLPLPATLSNVKASRQQFSLQTRFIVGQHSDFRIIATKYNTIP